jgi:cyclic pyranopterin phosphate synthase
MKKSFSHLDESGRLKMVDVSAKAITRRVAKARCTVSMKPETLGRIVSGKIPKGDVLACAKVSGIMAAKKTHELVPLCHPLPIEHIEIMFDHNIEKGELIIDAETVVTAKTGAEMEALEAAAQTALTVYDMCKAVDRGMVISEIKLLEKSGGKSGSWKRG